MTHDHDDDYNLRLLIERMHREGRSEGAIERAVTEARTGKRRHAPLPRPLGARPIRGLARNLRARALAGTRR
jgi:hypothetical protein